MENDNLLFLIGSIRRDSRQYVDKLLQEFSLTRYEWLVLACLKHAPEVSNQSFIRDYIGIDNSYLTKVLDKLERREYIVKVVSSQDRRSRLIKINPKKKNEIKKIFNILEDFNQLLLSRLSEANKVKLIDSLQKIKATLNNA